MNPKEIQIENYILKEIVGKGNFVVVYSCNTSTNPKLKAARIVSKKQISRDDCPSRLAFNERILAPLLIHPNILKIHSLIENQNCIIQISKLYERSDLLTSLKYHQFCERLKLNVIYETLLAINYLHSHYIAHRDLKLENILLTKGNHVKLIDFGLSTISFSGIVSESCGSYLYLSPETLVGQPYNVFAADMWAFGVICYAVFTRKMPFLDVRPGFNFPQPDYSALGPVAQFIQSLLSFDPSKRPTAKEALASPIFRIFRIQPKQVDQFSFLEPLPLPKKDTTDSTSIRLLSEAIQFPNLSIIQRVSSITQFDLEKINQLLHENSPNLAKLFYVLVKDKGLSDDCSESVHSLPPTKKNSSIIPKNGMNKRNLTEFPADFMTMLPIPSDLVPIGNDKTDFIAKKDEIQLQNEQNRNVIIINKKEIPLIPVNPLDKTFESVPITA